MGIFQTIGDIADTGFKKAKSRLERARANQAIADITSQQELRKTEDPREQAYNKQTLFARGLGKSTIADQDTSRLTGQQAARNAALARALHVAVRYKQYLKKARRHERVSQWLGILDGLVSLATAGGGGGATAFSGGAGASAEYGLGAGASGEYGFGGGASTSQGIGGGIF